MEDIGINAKNKKLCSDIKSENFSDFCEQITPSSLEKKCAYANNTCVEVDKTVGS